MSFISHYKAEITFLPTLTYETVEYSQIMQLNLVLCFSARLLTNGRSEIYIFLESLDFGIFVILLFTYVSRKIL